MKRLTLTGSSFDSQINKKNSTKDTMNASTVSSASSMSPHKRPVLIESEIKDDILLESTIEANLSDLFPLKRFILKSESLKAVYHAITVNNIVYFFRSSESIQKRRYIYFRARKIVINF